MNHLLFWVPSVGLFFFAICAFLLAGHFWRKYKNQYVSEAARSDMHIVETTIYAIMGLLIAFAFSGANTRLDQRRLLIIDEVNSVLATYYALDILPPEMQAEAHQDLKQYVNDRLEWYRLYPNTAGMDQQRQKYLQIQRELWNMAMQVCNKPGATQTCSLLPNALVNMITTENKKTLYKYLHPPTIVYEMLLAIVLLGSLLAGYTVRGNFREISVHMLLFALILSLMIFIILNLEFPRAGSFSSSIFDNFNTGFVSLQAMMK